MSATLWINSDAEETIELGESFTLLQVHAEIAHACGEDYSKFPELFQVVGAVLDQEDVDPGWLEKVRAQAREALKLEGLGEDARWVLTQLAGEVGEVENKTLDDYLLKSGFSGVKKDKLGRKVCYQNGKRVPCGERPKPPEVVEKPADQDKLAKDVRRWLGLMRRRAEDLVDIPEAISMIAGHLGVAPARVAWALRDLVEGSAPKPEPKPEPKEEGASPYSQRVEGASIQDMLRNDRYGAKVLQALLPAAREYEEIRDKWRAAEGRTRDTYQEYMKVTEPAGTDQHGPEARAALNAYDRAAVEQNTLLQEKRAKQIAFNQKFKEAIKAEHPHILRVDSTALPNTHGYAGEGLTRALKWLAGLVERKENEPEVPLVYVKESETGRAFYSGTYHGNKRDEVFLGLRSDDHTSVHELGHHLEHSLPGALQAAKEFLEHRVKDEPLTPLSQTFPGCGYEGWETGRKDGFDKAFDERSAYYVGKHYGHGSTEIISMGLEALSRDPAHFIVNDPEYAQFILGILSGRLRYDW